MHPLTLAKILTPVSLVAALSAGCQSGGGGGGGVLGNKGGSEPINKTEVVNYKKAVVKCYKTGGSRVVKIKGKLRCF